MFRLPVAAAIAAAGALLVTGCSSSTQSSTPSSSAPACPTAAIPVTVSVNQWGNIVEQLAGSCGEVTTVINSATGDPHDYEPTTGDIAEFSTAKLVVVNGGGYDEWALKAVEADSSKPALIDVAVVNDVPRGANPHFWYSPDYVTKTAAAITVELKKVVPDAAAYFDSQAATFAESMKGYYNEIASIKASVPGKTYGATESVFDYMARAGGLTNLTPQGYQNAAANESEPSPGDIAAFNKELAAKKINVLINNIQTDGSVPQQLVKTAQTAQVPVVNVTETMPADASSFQEWQIAQLQQLAAALGMGTG